MIQGFTLTDVDKAKDVVRTFEAAADEMESILVKFGQAGNELSNLGKNLEAIRPTLQQVTDLVKQANETGKDGVVRINKQIDVTVKTESINIDINE